MFPEPSFLSNFNVSYQGPAEISDCFMIIESLLLHCRVPSICEN